MWRLFTWPSSCATTTSTSPSREASVEERVPEHDVRRRAEAGRERVRLVGHLVDGQHAHGRAHALGALDPRDARAQRRVADRVRAGRAEPARRRTRRTRRSRRRRARRRSTSCARGAPARPTAIAIAAITEIAVAPSDAHWAESQAPTSNGPRPQWCCHQSSAMPNGSETNQSVASTTIPTTIALLTRPRPMPAHDRRHPAREDRERDERRDRREQPEDPLAAAEAARPRELVRARSSGGRRGPRGGATARTSARGSAAATSQIAAPAANASPIASRLARVVCASTAELSRVGGARGATREGRARRLRRSRRRARGPRGRARAGPPRAP